MGVGEAAEDQQLPLLISSSSNECNQPLKRTGTLPTAVAHIITGVIGAGVLSLAWSVAQLGWIGGPLLMLVFASVTILSTNLLSDCYRYPESDSPTRVGSYLEAVKVYLGQRSQTVCNICTRRACKAPELPTLLSCWQCQRIHFHQEVGVTCPRVCDCSTPSSGASYGI